MANVGFLDFQYKLSKSRILRKPSRLFTRNRQSSGLLPSFQPDLSELRYVFDKFDSNKDGKISQTDYKAILRYVFDKFDSNKDGKISQTDYKAILRALGQGSIINDVPKIFRVVDLDGDGFINFKEFVEVHKKSGGVRTMDIQSAFRMFDLNQDGKISAEEVMEVLRRLGETHSLEDCRRMVRAVDTDGDDMVDMDEFITMMTQTMKLG